MTADAPRDILKELKQGFLARAGVDDLRSFECEKFLERLSEIQGLSNGAVTAMVSPAIATNIYDNSYLEIRIEYRFRIPRQNNFRGNLAKKLALVLAKLEQVIWQC